MLQYINQIYNVLNVSPVNLRNLLSCSGTIRLTYSPALFPGVSLAIFGTVSEMITKCHIIMYPEELVPYALLSCHSIEKFVYQLLQTDLNLSC